MWTFSCQRVVWRRRRDGQDVDWYSKALSSFHSSEVRAGALSTLEEFHSGRMCRESSSDHNRLPLLASVHARGRASGELPGAPATPRDARRRDVSGSAGGVGCDAKERERCRGNDGRRQRGRGREGRGRRSGHGPGRRRQRVPRRPPELRPRRAARRPRARRRVRRSADQRGRCRRLASPRGLSRLLQGRERLPRRHLATVLRSGRSGYQSPLERRGRGGERARAGRGDGVASRAAARRNPRPALPPAGVGAGVGGGQQSQGADHHARRRAAISR